MKRKTKISMHFYEETWHRRVYWHRKIRMRKIDVPMLPLEIQIKKNHE